MQTPRLRRLQYADDVLVHFSVNLEILDQTSQTRAHCSRKVLVVLLWPDYSSQDIFCASSML